MKKWTRKELEQRTEDCNLTLTTYSPGDGKTRYKFHSLPGNTFFSSDGLYIALGMLEAMAYIQGYSDGQVYK